MNVHKWPEECKAGECAARLHERSRSMCIMARVVQGGLLSACWSNEASWFAINVWHQHRRIS